MHQYMHDIVAVCVLVCICVCLMHCTLAYCTQSVCVLCCCSNRRVPSCCWTSCHWLRDCPQYGPREPCTLWWVLTCPSSKTLQMSWSSLQSSWQRSPCLFYLDGWVLLQSIPCTDTAHHTHMPCKYPYCIYKCNIVCGTIWACFVIHTPIQWAVSVTEYRMACFILSLQHIHTPVMEVVTIHRYVVAYVML